MKTKDDDGLLMSGVFQFAEITRSLMCVSRTCDHDMACIFQKDHARVVDKDWNVNARFNRDGGLYTCTMRLRRPEAGNDPDFQRPVR